jgi:hypothetical protein
MLPHFQAGDYGQLSKQEVTQHGIHLLPAFIMEIGNGKTLCIPTIFVSYTGESA